MISQDPITTRFIEAFHYLKEKEKVRSARQFALGIGTYPQSLNDILKGRRDATLPMIQKVTEVYHINCHYLLTGKGEMTRSDINGISRSPQSFVRYIHAHEYSAFAGAIKHENLDSHSWTDWALPAEMVGQNIDMAFQCNTDRISRCLRKGDVLFARRMPREVWKSSLSSKRIYVIALETEVHIVRFTTNDAQGLYLSQDDRDLPNYISFEDIQEIWSTISRWSPSVLIDDQEGSQSQLDQLSHTLQMQTDMLSSLGQTVTRLAETMTSEQVAY